MIIGDMEEQKQPKVNRPLFILILSGAFYKNIKLDFDSNKTVYLDFS